MREPHKHDFDFIAEVKWNWDFNHIVNAVDMPRLLSLAEQGADANYMQKNLGKTNDTPIG